MSGYTQCTFVLPVNLTDPSVSNIVRTTYSDCWDERALALACSYRSRSPAPRRHESVRTRSRSPSRAQPRRHDSNALSETQRAALRVAGRRNAASVHVDPRDALPRPAAVHAGVLPSAYITALPLMPFGGAVLPPPPPLPYLRGERLPPPPPILPSRGAHTGRRAEHSPGRERQRTDTTSGRAEVGGKGKGTTTATESATMIAIVTVTVTMQMTVSRPLCALCAYNNITLLYGSSCTNNGNGALSTPETLPLFSPCVQFPTSLLTRLKFTCMKKYPKPTPYLLCTPLTRLKI
eukprot:7646891-Pyramimonas_sp.AAC.1